MGSLQGHSYVLVASFSLRIAVPSPASVLPWRGEGMAARRLRFFRKGLKETYSDKFSQLSWKIFHFALKSFVLNFCNWTELVFRLFVDTGSLDQLFRYLFPFFHQIIHSHEKRSDRKQDNFLGWSCIKKKKKKVVDLALRVSLLDAVSWDEISLVVQ